MSNLLHTLAQQLTGKATLEECTVEEAERISQRYPYFAPAQFLLLQKLRQTDNTDAADAQYKKAVLFYHHPLQFDRFISLPEKQANQLFTETVSQTSAALLQSDEFEVVSAPVETTALLPVEPIADIVEAPQTRTDPTQKESIDDETTPPSSLILPGTETVSDEYIQPGALHPETALPPAEIQQPPVALAEAAEVVKKVAASELSFEPFHTVDYFASQGIKILQEELPKDKLGKGLKSFTEWLKTMKRLPASERNEALESVTESKVEAFADHSISQSDVVTEAMAEVWSKQGDAQKALEIYNKLSLRNPSKRAYFAAKIENLKPR